VNRTMLFFAGKRLILRIVKAFYFAIITPMKSNFIALDFETANNDRSSACAIGLVKVENGKIVAKESRLINPHTNFLHFCVAVHGLTEVDVEDAPSFDEVWQELSPLLKDTEFVRL
jgi:DNA polymerase-3 subunit epsilon